MIHGIDLGTDFAAERLVVVVAGTEGQRQVVGQAPVVFQEDRILVALHLHDGIGNRNDRRTQAAAGTVLELFVLVGQATCQCMGAKEIGRLGVGRQHVVLDAIAGIGVDPRRVLRGVVVDVGIQQQVVVTPFVGDGVGLEDRLVVARLVGHVNALARIGPTALQRFVVVEGDQVLLVDVPAQLAAQVASSVPGVGGSAVVTAEEMAFVLVQE